MNASDNHGQFVWYDLLTSDPKAAIAFYTHVAGWTTQPFGEAEGDEAYMMWVGSQGPLGGAMLLSKEAQQRGAPPHWMAHVTVADLEATLEKARTLGARVLREPETIPGVGRFALIQDPQGAHLSLFTHSNEMKLHDRTKHGEFSWNELVTTDHQAAFSFYHELFGWEKLRSHDMGPMGEYLIYGIHGQSLGGMFTKGPGMDMPPSWVFYIHVEDLEGALERAKAGGAQVMHGPADVPGGDRIAQLSDPQGVVFALHASPPGRA